MKYISLGELARYSKRINEQLVQYDTKKKAVVGALDNIYNIVEGDLQKQVKKYKDEYEYDLEHLYNNFLETSERIDKYVVKTIENEDMMTFSAREVNEQLDVIDSLLRTIAYPGKNNSTDTYRGDLSDLPQ